MKGFEGIHPNRLRIRFRRPDGEISRRELFKLVLPRYEVEPFGKLELDDSQCTGCGLCALDCPGEALTVSTSKESGYQLLFRQDLCDACGKCIETCPEKCLRLKRIPVVENMDAPPEVLFEDKIVRCRECGDVVGSMAMIDRLRARLSNKEDPLAAQFGLCSSCKIKAQFSLGRTTLEPPAKPG